MAPKFKSTAEYSKRYRKKHRDAVNVKQRERKRRIKEAMTIEEKEILKEKNREAKCRERSKMSANKVTAVGKKDRERKAKRKAKSTPPDFSTPRVQKHRQGHCTNGKTVEQTATELCATIEQSELDTTVEQSEPHTRLIVKISNRTGADKRKYKQMKKTLNKLTNTKRVLFLQKLINSELPPTLNQLYCPRLTPAQTLL